MDDYEFFYDIVPMDDYEHDDISELMQDNE